MKLLDSQVKAFKPTEKTQKKSDGGGLYLYVNPNGSKWWRFLYRFGGKQQTLSLGVYPTISLKEAREKANAMRELLDKGINPSLERKESKIKQAHSLENTFASVARAWWENFSAGVSKKHADKVWVRMERDGISLLGTYPIEAITPALVVLTVKSVVKRGSVDVAKRLYEDIGRVMRYAKTHGLIEYNPASDLDMTNVIPPVKVQHQKRVELTELPTLLNAINQYKGNRITVIATQLMALTFVRTSELIGARWADINFKTKRWTIPAEVLDSDGQKEYGMKMSVSHVVPLSKQSIALLRELHDISGGGTQLFPSIKGEGKTMSNATILKALERMGFKGEMTGHGFRGIASTALRENGFKRELVELQLSHQVGNDVERAYNSMELLPERTEMMQWWADYLDKLRIEGVRLRVAR